MGVGRGEGAMTKPTITIEDIIAYHEREAKRRGRLAAALRNDARKFPHSDYLARAEVHAAAAAAHREAAALLRKGLDE